MGREIIVHDSPKAPVSESIRLLRTNLEFMCGNKKNQILLFTSAAPGDGKSWVTANLAIAYAQSGKNVLLVDADLRKGRQHKIFSKFNRSGFSDYIKSMSDEIVADNDVHEEILMKSMLNTEVGNLFLITSGTVPPNPTELLNSKYIDSFLDLVKDNFDVIIFDMPPVSIVADSLVLCKKVDYVVLVAAAEETKKDVLINAQKSIKQVNGKIAGIVFNKMPIAKRKDYVKYYSHYADDSLPSVTSKDVSKTTSNIKRRRTRS
mgnify:CR=1 FL=1